MAKDTEAKVRAVVVRGSYWKVVTDASGATSRVEVLPGKGKESEVDVTQSQLDNFVGVLVPISQLAVEEQKAALEGMQPATPPDESSASTRGRSR